MPIEKTKGILKLTHHLHTLKVGASVDEISEEYGISRRTAYRWLNEIRNSGLWEVETVEYSGESGVVRYKIVSAKMPTSLNIGPDELADLEVAVSKFKQDNLLPQAKRLQGLLNKVQALMDAPTLTKSTADLETLTEAEGLVMRVGPRPNIKPLIMDALRKAIKASSEITIRYHNRTRGTTKDRLVRPYGFIHGHRHYLVGFHIHEKANCVTMFRIPDIKSVKLTDRIFVKPSDFNLQEFTERSFGTYQEEPFDVVWKFSHEAAEAAKDFQFHPSQTLDEQIDGTLVVKFRAGGLLEMAWHLFMWGDKVEVIEPLKLRDMMENHRPNWDALP
ncbi:hypothetical protein A9Q83_04210 [Alphaproteobacteria bacterium 46_93_T64]|nr:hypothetical protein A9Q83_04210 [Alphaproteobacteria bacterium 46_93_T64]